MKSWLIVAAAVLAGCQLPAPPAGPASLQIVPADYYSVRAGPSRGHTRPPEKTVPPPAPPVAAPALVIPPEVKSTIQRMNERTKDIRSTVSKP